MVDDRYEIPIHCAWKQVVQQLASRHNGRGLIVGLWPVGTDEKMDYFGVITIQPRIVRARVGREREIANEATFAFAPPVRLRNLYSYLASIQAVSKGAQP
jgi:hypothetical protein